jgi:hypothetical protein
VALGTSGPCREHDAYADIRQINGIYRRSAASPRAGMRRAIGVVEFLQSSTAHVYRQQTRIRDILLPRNAA